MDTKIYYFFSTSFFAGHKIRVEWYKVCINKIRKQKKMHNYIHIELPISWQEVMAL